jgi:hypothetical protein
MKEPIKRSKLFFRRYKVFHQKIKKALGTRGRELEIR